MSDDEQEKDREARCRWFLEEWRRLLEDTITGQRWLPPRIDRAGEIVHMRERVAQAEADLRGSP